MLRALQEIVNRHFAGMGERERRPTKEMLDIIVESSHGDIRSAIMALQFASVRETSSKGRKRKKGVETRALCVLLIETS